jgi:hypothetical protein
MTTTPREVHFSLTKTIKAAQALSPPASDDPRVRAAWDRVIDGLRWCLCAPLARSIRGGRASLSGVLRLACSNPNMRYFKCLIEIKDGLAKIVLIE